MRMYVKVMAAVIACILMSGETHSTSATIPATENQSWFKKRKKKPEQEEKTKSLWKVAKLPKECLLFIKKRTIIILKFLHPF